MGFLISLACSRALPHGVALCGASPHWVKPLIPPPPLSRSQTRTHVLPDAVEDSSDGNSEDPATPDEPETTPETPEPTTDDQPPATATPAAPKEKAPLEPLVPLGDDDLADVFARLPDDMRAMFLDLEDAGATPFVRDATLDTPAAVNVVEVAFPPPPVPPKSEV